MARTCAWCKGPIPEGARRDAICCSVRCRQARHRFTTGVGVGVVQDRGEPLRLAYADPPYPGKSKRYYGEHPDYAGEVDHRALIEQLMEFDGWALSTSASALLAVGSLCPPGTRVGSWTRGYRGGKSLRPMNAWEPVLYWGGREVAPWRSGDPADVSRQAAAEADASVAVAGENDESRDAGATLRADALVLINKPRTTDPDRVIGSKPAGFCRWVFDLLGAQPGDDFTDVFPGSGGVMRAWRVFDGE